MPVVLRLKGEVSEDQVQANVLPVRGGLNWSEERLCSIPIGLVNLIKVFCKFL